MGVALDLCVFSFALVVDYCLPLICTFSAMLAFLALRTGSDFYELHGIIFNVELTGSALLRSPG